MTDNAYVHDEVSGADISGTGDLLTLRTRGRDTVTVTVRADVASDFAIDIDSGNGFVDGYETFSATDSVDTTLTVATERVRVRNTTAQTSGDTADVTAGAV